MDGIPENGATYAPKHVGVAKDLLCVVRLVGFRVNNFKIYVVT